VDISRQRLDVVHEIAHNKYINCMEYSPQGTLIASGDIDGAVRVFDATSKELVGKPYSNHGRGVKCIKFSPDGKSLISGSEDLHMHVCDVET